MTRRRGRLTARAGLVAVVAAVLLAPSAVTVDHPADQGRSGQGLSEQPRSGQPGPRPAARAAAPIPATTQTATQDRPAAAQPITAACPAGDAPITPFADTRGNPHARAVDCVHWHGVAAGRTVWSFAPARPVGRDQMASFLARSLTTAGVHLGEPQRDHFDDIAGNAHRRRINQLAAHDVVAGTGDGSYSPHAAVSRAQMASLLVATWELATGGPAPAGDDAFTDDDGSVHEPAIDAAAALGLVTGVSAERFAPAPAVRRDRMARFVGRLLSSLAERDLVTPPPVSGDTTASRLPPALRARMTGTSWHGGCPVGLDGLRLLTVHHHDLRGRRRIGLMVVADEAAADVAAVLERAYDAGVGLHRMRPVSAYGGDDRASMRANNSSAFNCRRVTGGDGWSRHAHGTAVDLNPLQNPYLDDGEVLPEGGWTDRDDVRPGMFVEGGPVVTAFDEHGWGWGGRWSSLKDWMHFSATGG